MGIERDPPDFRSGQAAADVRLTLSPVCGFEALPALRPRKERVWISRADGHGHDSQRHPRVDLRPIETLIEALEDSRVSGRVQLAGTRWKQNQDIGFIKRQIFAVRDVGPAFSAVLASINSSPEGSQIDRARMGRVEDNAMGGNPSA